VLDGQRGQVGICDEVAAQVTVVDDGGSGRD
jgi:hypothetical protein